MPGPVAGDGHAPLYDEQGGGGVLQTVREGGREGGL
jgi:hypothetical protein